MLASAVVWYVRKTKHSKVRHSTAQHGTARHSTALRRAVELAKLNGAGGVFLVLSATAVYAAGCDTKKELEPASTESD